MAEHDFDYDTWFDLMRDECKALGYRGPIDKATFEQDYDEGMSPEYVAGEFVKEMNEDD